jgi:hypothetical protein
MSDDSFLYLIYRRFFAVMMSVLPGLLLVFAFPAVTMLILDLIGAPMGWSLFAGFVVLVFTFIGSIFLGLLIQDKMAPHEPNT